MGFIQQSSLLVRAWIVIGYPGSFLTAINTARVSIRNFWAAKDSHLATVLAVVGSPFVSHPQPKLSFSASDFPPLSQGARKGNVA